jgi:hypothetical protein
VVVVLAVAVAAVVVVVAITDPIVNINRVTSSSMGLWHKHDSYKKLINSM